MLCPLEFDENFSIYTIHTGLSNYLLYICIMYKYDHIWIGCCSIEKKLKSIYQRYIISFLRKMKNA